jgi:hypothetical protein
LRGIGFSGEYARDGKGLYEYDGQDLTSVIIYNAASADGNSLF